MEVAVEQDDKYSKRNLQIQRTGAIMLVVLFVVGALLGGYKHFTKPMLPRHHGGIPFIEPNKLFTKKHAHLPKTLRGLRSNHFLDGSKNRNEKRRAKMQKMRDDLDRRLARNVPEKVDHEQISGHGGPLPDEKEDSREEPPRRQDDHA